MIKANNRDTWLKINWPLKKEKFLPQEKIQKTILTIKNKIPVNAKWFLFFLGKKTSSKMIIREPATRLSIGADANMLFIGIGCTLD